MLNKYLKVVISAVILAASGYASKASADFVESELSLTTYNWSATCYDCKDGNDINKRPEDPTLWKGVTGSITLSDYTLGDAITGANFVSFAYTGVSQFLPMFTVGTGEGFDFTTVQVAGTLFANAELTLDLLGYNNSPDPREPIYNDLPTLEDLVVNYDADYELTLKNAQVDCQDSLPPPSPPSPSLDDDDAPPRNNAFDVCMANAQIAYRSMAAAILTAQATIDPIADANERLETEYNAALASYVELLHISVTPSDWSFGRARGVAMDIGSSFVVLGLPPVTPANQVSEPATLAIFALGLMGLGLRRIKKQS